MTEKIELRIQQFIEEQTLINNLPKNPGYKAEGKVYDLEPIHQAFVEERRRNLAPNTKAAKRAEEIMAKFDQGFENGHCS